MQKLEKKDLEDIMIGSAYLGTGGGGKLTVGSKLISNALKDGLEFNLMDVAEMGDDDYAAAPYDLGSLAPPSAEEQAKYDHLPTIKEPTTMAAFRALQHYEDKNFTAVIAGEIGPENTAASLIVAAKLGIASLDADTVGRATPEIDQHSVLVSRGKITPAAGATQFGDVVILSTDKKSSREEDIFRAIAEVSLGIGVADAPIPGRVAKKPGVLVTGSISLCRRIGAAYHKAVDHKEDPIEAALTAGDGYRLFAGTITKSSYKNVGGFTVGQVSIAGDGKHAKENCDIDFKNENIIALVDQHVIASVPDLITVIDQESGEPIGNPEFNKGQKVVVIGFRANPIWRKGAGLKVFDPRHFGYDYKYVPIEQLNR